MYGLIKSFFELESLEIIRMVDETVLDEGLYGATVVGWSELDIVHATEIL